MRENIAELVRMTGLLTSYNLLNVLFLGLCRIINTCKWLCAGAGMIIHISKRSKFFTITNNWCVEAVLVLLASFYVFMFIIIIPGVLARPKWKGILPYHFLASPLILLSARDFFPFPSRFFYHYHAVSSILNKLLFSCYGYASQRANQISYIGHSNVLYAYTPYSNENICDRRLWFEVY